MKIFQSALDALRRARRPYLILRLLYYALILWTMVYVVFDRTIQETLGQLVLDTLGTGPLAPVLDAFDAGQMLLAVVLIFAINLVGATFMAITLPSLIIPFCGLLLFALRAVLWGILFAPELDGTLDTRAVLEALGVAVLMILEGEGYILGAVGAFIQGRALFRPSSVGASKPLQGYRYGIRDQLKLYLLIIPVLLIAAVYEVALLYFSVPVQ
jgi:hypothetical protein